MLYQPSDIVLGKYRVERFIGKGASAEVYLATHLELKAPRALKVLSRELPGVGSTAFGDYCQRFQLEAQLGARINHPNVIQVHDFHQDEDTLALVMEYAAGGSLSDRIAKARESGQPVTVEEAVRIGREVAQGLSALHALDCVHRDLKPSYILLDVQGRAKLADLGLAQVPGGPSQRSVLSQPMAHPGTPAYVSPEQRHTNEHLTPASDVYALGCVLFELLTGRLFRNVQPGTRLMSLRPDVPDWLDGLIMRMASEDPRQRPWDGAKVAYLLQQGAGAPKPVSRRDFGGPTGLSSKSETPPIGGRRLWGRLLSRLGLSTNAGLAAVLLCMVLVLVAIIYAPFWPIPGLGPAPTAPLQTRAATTGPATATPDPVTATLTLALTSTATPVRGTATSTVMPTASVVPSPIPSATRTATAMAAAAPTAAPLVITLAPGVTMELVRVPAGPFLMGSADSDSMARDNEKPQHTVTLREYSIGKYEVTQAQWAAFVKATGYASYAEQSSGKEDHPVTVVNWGAAVEFTKWASQASGRAVRLATEAEWEKAARGTDGRKYPWGNQAPDSTRCNFNGDVGETTPAGKYSPKGDSPYGAADMCGNVLEWVGDWYDGEYYASSPAANPAGPIMGSDRVLRGGAFNSNGGNARCALRYGGTSWNLATGYFGFRVVAPSP
jgi:formylglycine-generating enzyme required for sulfatase activity